MKLAHHEQLLHHNQNSSFWKKTNKKINQASTAAFSFSFALLIVLLFFTGTGSAVVVSGDTHLAVEVSEITPNPARPGEDLLLKINIENTGDEPAKNVRIGIEEVNPFIFKYSTLKIYRSGTNTERSFEIEQIRHELNSVKEEIERLGFNSKTVILKECIKNWIELYSSILACPTPTPGWNPFAQKNRNIVKDKKCLYFL